MTLITVSDIYKVSIFLWGFRSNQFIIMYYIIICRIFDTLLNDFARFLFARNCFFHIQLFIYHDVIIFLKTCIQTLNTNEKLLGTYFKRLTLLVDAS